MFLKKMGHIFVTYWIFQLMNGISWRFVNIDVTDNTNVKLALEAWRQYICTQYKVTLNTIIK